MKVEKDFFACKSKFRLSNINKVKIAIGRYRHVMHSDEMCIFIIM